MTSVDLRHLRYFAAVAGVRTSRELPQTAREKFCGQLRGQSVRTSALPVALLLPVSEIYEVALDARLSQP